MDKRTFLLSMASVTLLTGCNFINQFVRSPEKPTEQQVASSSNAQPTTLADTPRKQKEVEIKQQFGEDGGVYRNYQEGDIGNGKEVVLFFHAAWSPDCQKHDEELRDWYSANYIPLSVLKLDYDSAIGLKQRYNVVQQDTFVRINGAGEAVATKSYPTELELLNMLRP